MKKSYAIFLPCFEVESAIENVILNIPEKIWLGATKIYCIDNRSTDRTLELLYKTSINRPHPGFEILRNSQNITLGGSTIVAFERSIKDKIDYVLCLHSDGQANPKDLEKFVEKFGTDSPDFIAGRRSNYQNLRHFGNLFFHRLQKSIFSLDHAWDLGGFLAFRMETVKKLPFRRIPANMAYHPHLILLAQMKLAQTKIVEVPVDWGKVEKSSINPFVYGISHLIRLFLIYFELSLTKEDQLFESNSSLETTLTDRRLP
jgi:glycosyltransferase involved in cell wall biosynthesis